MRLKRLEIQGFKSFARPVCLEFGPGITAIVGPNGSGKSNISDALRWVMGEQSAKSLRGYKMEDVIFAGSEGKKPLGMAEVQLTLDNSNGFFPLDYAEVTVARRVYRSGDSEFLINKQNCRLRDIHDLFTDTGLGKEGYAIIGQGQIDAVLSVRSEDRRVLLEETAGIVKYRQRKEQALRKLEDTSLDLLRVSDVLQELQNQLESLEEQAQVARLYLSLEQRLRAAELDEFNLTWKQLEEKWEQNENNLKALQAEFTKYNQELAVVEEEKNKMDTIAHDLENEIECWRQELIDLTAACNQGVHLIELHQERLNNHKSRSEILTNLIHAKEEELVILGAENKEIDKETQKQLEDIQALKELISKEEENIHSLQLNQLKAGQEINYFKDEFFEFMRELADQRNFQRNFSERKNNLTIQIKLTQNNLADLQKRINESNRKVAEFKTEQTNLAKKIETYLVEDAQVQGCLKKNKDRLIKLQIESRQREAQFVQVKSRLKTLQELEAGYEGYAVGVKRIMQDREMSKLVLGTVADVVQVPSGLETAFEVALGSSLQNLIATNEQHAKSLINWLKKQQGGRVTILPLDAMRSLEFSKDVKKLFKQSGILGSALDLLEFDARFQPALASLLGRIVITEDLDTALNLKRQLRQFSRIVTRDGSVVFPSGAMTGGSLNNRTSGLLVRKSELVSLKEEANHLEQKLEAISQTENELKTSITQSEEKSGILSGQVVEIRLEKQQINQARELLLFEIEQLQKNYKEFEQKNVSLQIDLMNLTEKTDQAGILVTRLEQEEGMRRKQMQLQEKTFSDLTNLVDDHTHQLTEKQVKLAELKGVLENQHILRATVEQRKNVALLAKEEALTELETIAELNKENKLAILEITANNEKNNFAKIELQNNLENKKLKRQEHRAELERLGTILIQFENDQLKRERTLYRSEVLQEQLQDERDQILTTLKERDVSLENVLNRKPSDNALKLKRQITELRNQIKDLGSVNPGATLEYERVFERCLFLKTQLEDLDEAKEGLQDVIDEMDKLCQTKLRDAFKKVQAEFQKVFKQLFLGGHAELVLSEPNSILTTGIDVMARPPGKKLQNLLALSGGERALTAIALLFAIRRVQPTPFWVLDEIDAALDESNLGRFVELMQDFSQNTQFLVVTHRPRTMEAADTLYGVTMGEEAFSQIISVALS